MSKNVIIIGAGLTGLSIALNLKKNEPDTGITILEKSDKPGGLLSGFNLDGHWVDKGTFFFNNEFTPNLLELFPDDLETVRSNKHLVWYGNNRFGSFPVDLKVALSRLSKPELLRFACTFPFLLLRKNLGLIGSARNAEQWLTKRITRQFYRTTGLREYISKLEGIPPVEVSPLFGQERLHRVEEYLKPWELAKFVLKRLFGINLAGTYDKLTTKYPRSGSVSIVCDALAKQAGAAGIDIRYNTGVDAISLQANTYTLTSGNDTFTTEHLVSTIAIDEFLQKFTRDGQPAPETGLQYRNLLCVYFILKGDQVLKDIPVYYSYDPAHRWKRLVSFSSIMPSVSPAGESSICVEWTYDNDEDIADLETIKKEVTANLAGDLKLFGEDQIKKIETATVQNAYPLLKIGYDEEYKKAMDYFAGLPHFITAGRLGTFNQDNTSDCLKKSGII